MTLRNAVAYLLPPDGPAQANPEGLDITRTIEETDRVRRPGLTEALQTIAAGEAEVLLLQRLGAAARSLGDLIRLLSWLEQHDASLLAQDLGLDTSQAEGRRTALVLREIERWGREPEPPHRPPGRPGLDTTAPQIAERIGQLREQGLSLRAIADALNAEDIPTPRGGSRWRASSVQSALGYRRPQPPAPGLPRPGPPHHPPAHPPHPRKPGPP